MQSRVTTAFYNASQFGRDKKSNIKPTNKRLSECYRCVCCMDVNTKYIGSLCSIIYVYNSTLNYKMHTTTVYKKETYNTQVVNSSTVAHALHWNRQDQRRWQKHFFLGCLHVLLHRCSVCSSISLWPVVVMLVAVWIWNAEPHERTRCIWTGRQQCSSPRKVARC